MKRLEGLAARMVIQEGILKKLYAVESKKKVGRNQDMKDMKEAALNRINIELEELRAKKISMENEYNQYEALRNDMQDDFEGYAAVMNKKCFKKIGAIKKTGAKKPKRRDDDTDEDSDIDDTDEDFDED
jgi:hypothetical protein